MLKIALWFGQGSDKHTDSYSGWRTLSGRRIYLRRSSFPMNSVLLLKKLIVPLFSGGITRLLRGNFLSHFYDHKCTSSWYGTEDNILCNSLTQSGCCFDYVSCCYLLLLLSAQWRNPTNVTGMRYECSTSTYLLRSPSRTSLSWKTCIFICSWTWTWYRGNGSRMSSKL